MKNRNTIIRLKMYNNENGIQNDINLYITDNKNVYSTPHTHTFFEFMLVVKGQLTHSVDGNERTLCANDICVLSPDAQHAIKRHDNGEFLLYNFEVRIEYLEILCKALGFPSIEAVFPYHEHYNKATVAETAEYLKIITIPNKVTITAHNEISQTWQKIIIVKLLSGFILHPSQNLVHNKENSIIEKMMALLEDKDNFHLPIKDLCEKAFYTQEHITRLFKKAKLPSPNHVHLQKKLQYAAHLLLNSDMKIINIAEKCGIETVSYFTKTFKREYGSSPSIYKKIYRR